MRGRPAAAAAAVNKVRLAIGMGLSLSACAAPLFESGFGASARTVARSAQRAPPRFYHDAIGRA
jgi:hypothetical protein